MVPLGYRESDDVMTGSLSVFCVVAIEQTLGRSWLVGVAEEGPPNSDGQIEVATQGAWREDIVIVDL